MHEAYFYKQHNSNKIQCLLCPHKCVLNNNQWGICNARKPENGILYDINYGRVSSLAIDPIEKKPLYHYHPNTHILSVGGLGCNFRCNFCQNHSISQISTSQLLHTKEISAQQIIATAIDRTPKAGIAFTYNEPFINYNFILDTAKLAKKNEIPVAVVTNGYINEKPLAELLPFVDAFNVDLKAFTNLFYQQFIGGKLQPVLNTLKQIAEADKHLEITHLLVTNANDDTNDFVAMIQWISKTLGTDIPLHISRYFPQYQLKAPATDVNLLAEFIDIAREKLKFVYPGNTNQDTSTYCPNCGAKIIKRSGYSTQIIALSEGKCLNCSYELSIH